MSRQLIESIVSGNLIAANDVFEAKLAEIRERKVYEMKKRFAAEAFGGMTKAEIEAKKKAGYRKAADVLKDPRERKIPPLPDMKKERKISEQSGPIPLKKDPRLRTPERYRKAIERYNTLKARGSNTASDRQAKIDRGYAGTVVKSYLKKELKAAPGKLANAPVFDDLKSIGMRNI